MDGLPEFERECFFAAPIGDEGSDVRKRSDGVLKFIVANAAEQSGLAAVRADLISKPGQITLQVVEHVMQAKAVVADLTGINANVFYELAIRHAVRKPVVLIAEEGTKLPFDIAQLRTIFFRHNDLESADTCRREIVSQLREGLADGYVDSPVGTVLDVSTLKGGNLVEQNLAELVTSVGALSNSQQALEALMRDLRHSVFAEQELPSAPLRDLIEASESLQALASGSEDKNLRAAVAALTRPVDYLAGRPRRPSRSGMGRAATIRELSELNMELDAARKADPVDAERVALYERRLRRLERTLLSMERMSERF